MQKAFIRDCWDQRGITRTLRRNHGIDVILVENLVTIEYNFEISYEELADILAR